MENRGVNGTSFAGVDTEVQKRTNFLLGQQSKEVANKMLSKYR